MKLVGHRGNLFGRSDAQRPSQPFGAVFDEAGDIRVALEDVPGAADQPHRDPHPDSLACLEHQFALPGRHRRVFVSVQEQHGRCTGVDVAHRAGRPRLLAKALLSSTEELADGLAPLVLVPEGPEVVDAVPVDHGGHVGRPDADPILPIQGIVGRGRRQQRDESPPADSPQAPILFGSIPNSPANARRYRIAAFTS